MRMTQMGHFIGCGRFRNPVIVSHKHGDMTGIFYSFSDLNYERVEKSWNINSW